MSDEASDDGKVFCINCKHCDPSLSDNRNLAECQHPNATLPRLVDYVTGRMTYMRRLCSLKNDDGLCQDYEER